MSASIFSGSRHRTRAALQHLHHRAGAQKRQVVPALQVGVDPGRKRGQNLFARVRHAVGSQRGRNQAAHDARIEGVARQSHAAVAQQVCGTASAPTHSRPHVQQRKVAGAAAEVADQDQLVVVERRFVGIGRGHRLHLELHLLVAGELKRMAQTAQRVGFVLAVFRACKMHRTPHRGVAHRHAKLPLGMQAQVGQHARDQIFHGVMPPQNLGAGEQAAGQVALERLNQPPLVLGLQILFDGPRPGPRLQVTASGFFVLLKIEHRAERFRAAARGDKAHQLHRIARGPRQRTVGGSKIDADGGGMFLVGRHTLLFQRS